MKKELIAIGAAVLVLAVVLVLLLPGGDTLPQAKMKPMSDYQSGVYYREARENSENKLLAAYKDIGSVYDYDVEFMRNVTYSAVAGVSERDLINVVLRGFMLLEEAEQRGLAATQEEIEAMVEGNRMAYEMPEGKQSMDDYCAGAGISIEEHYEIIRAQAPETIAIQKLELAVAQEYCEENGVEFSMSDKKVKAAVEKFKNELFSKNKKYIEYYD